MYPLQLIRIPNDVRAILVFVQHELELIARIEELEVVALPQRLVLGCASRLGALIPEPCAFG